MIQLDSITSATLAGGGAGATLTFPHICYGENRILIVTVAINDSNQTNNPILNIDYGGINMTRLCRTDSSGVTNGDAAVEIWYLMNPKAGVSDILTLRYSNVNYVGAAAYSFTGVRNIYPNMFKRSGYAPFVDLKQYPPSSILTDTAVGATVSESVQTQDLGSWVLDVLSSETQPTVGPSQTLQWQNTNQSFQWGQGSTYVASAAESVPMSWTSTNNWAYAACVLAPSDFWADSFLHTLGRALYDQSVGQKYTNTQSFSEITIPSTIRITQITEAEVNTNNLSMIHTVKSLDEVVVIFVYATPNNISSLTINGITATPFSAGAAFGNVIWGYYITTPQVGQNSIAIVGTSETMMSMMAVSLIGVDKNNAVLGGQLSSGSATTINTINTINNPGSIILDAIMTSVGGLSPDSLQSTILNRTNIRNFGTSLRNFTSGQQKMSWTLSSGSYAYTYVILSPLRPVSIWYSIRSTNLASPINGSWSNGEDQLWRNSFLHTVGRIINPTQGPAVVTPAGATPITSQIVIDKITQLATASGSTSSVDHYVSSQDAVMVIFASQMGVAQGINSVTLNGNALNNLSPNNVSTLAGGIFYVTNPNVGLNTVSINVTLSAALEIVVMTLLGVDKKALNPVVISSNGLASSPSTSITPSSANSLVLDYVGTLAGAGSPDSSQIQYFEQPQTGSSAFGSMKLAGPSQQTMSWTTAGAAWAQFIIALEPAQAASYWFPMIGYRNSLDIINANAMDVNINPTGNYLQTNGYFPSTFYQNSFLHTVGRRMPPNAILAASGPWRSMMGMGY